MPQGNIFSRLCSGNVTVSSFVKVDSANPEHVILCSANTDAALGISQEGAYLPPIPQQTGTQYAGTTTSPPIRIYGPGTDQVLLITGTGGFSAGDLIMSDANGAGVTATSNNLYNAQAQETQTTAGILARVTVLSPAKK
jgi:hypothetical protein